MLKDELESYILTIVDNQSFELDIKILWLTFLKVVKRSDISSDTAVTMENLKVINN